MCEIPHTLSSLAVKTRQGMPQDVHEEDNFILLASLISKMDKQNCETQCEHQDYKTQRQIIFEADAGWAQVKFWSLQGFSSTGLPQNGLVGQEEYEAWSLGRNWQVLPGKSLMSSRILVGISFTL